MIAACGFLLTVTLAATPAPAKSQEHTHSHASSSQAEKDRAAEFGVPQSLKAEHDELHAELVRATQSGGQTAEAAKEVARLLHLHFAKEEQYGLPQLGALAALADGRDVPGSSRLIELSEKLKAEMPQMLKEHQAIVVALKRLRDAAAKESKPECARFAEKLTLHAQAEEEIYYPASILVGQYLKLKLDRETRHK
jgi:hypothetical protein